MKTEAIAYRPFWRFAAALLVVVSRGSPVALAALLVFLDDWLGTSFRLGNPLRLLRAFALFCLAPGIAAWLLGRALGATLNVENGMLALQFRRQRMEIPCNLIDGVAPWTIALPAGGVRLRLTSGRWFAWGLQVADPPALIRAIADGGAPEHVRLAAAQPAAVYARSRQCASRRWYHPLLAFVVFALVPTLPIFRLHQWIAYGGTFGEYYLHGPKAYLLAFGLYWATFTIHLVLFAAVLRAVAEPLVLATAWLAPARTLRMRRIVETAIRVLYFGGVPLLLLRLLLLS